VGRGVGFLRKQAKRLVLIEAPNAAPVKQ